jgi:hypothetical protein
VKRRGFVSRRGHRFVFFDDDAKSGIAMLTSDGKVRLALNETSAEVHLYCEGKIILESKGDMSFKSQGNVTIEGSSGVAVKSNGTVEVKGTIIKLN